MSPPPAAVTVRVEEPRIAVDAAFSVSVLLPLPGEAMFVGAKLAVTPLGSPLTESVTAAVNPLTVAVVTVMGVDPPRATITFVPPAVSVKLGAITVRLSVWVFVTFSPEPVTVGE